MTKEVLRASWNLTYEKGLVDILHDHSSPKFKRQNGWVTEGWKSIVTKFNEKFPLARFTKQQIQEKKKELKGNCKAIRNARKQSGSGWDNTLGMIIVEPRIWDKIIQDFPKVKKFRSKPFPIFNSLAALYEGSVVTGDLNYVSIPQVQLKDDQVSSNAIDTPKNDSHLSSSFLDPGLNPFSTNPQGIVASSVDNKEDTEPTTSACSGKKGEGSGRKRKQSQLALVLEDYLDYRKQQTTVLVEDMNEAPNEDKKDDKFSVANCVAALEAMEELTDLEKAKALPLFKC